MAILSEYFVEVLLIDLLLIDLLIRAIFRAPVDFRSFASIGSSEFLTYRAAFSCESHVTARGMNPN